MNNTIPVITIRELNYRNDWAAKRIPIGTRIDLAFHETRHNRAIFTHNGKKYALLVRNLYRTVKATNHVKFYKEPSISKLEKMSDDGICTTVTGDKVEPDGFGENGSPSWLLVMGLI